ncbi:MAG: class I SAM-dependent RNA methyltransferase [Lachnospiraceae bacterium]|jgi:putative N6-adenine-specific DNA methylase|nr:class I SAM-dependent RNA methyltransferase [Lachnospiraceae bacterium]
MKYTLVSPCHFGLEAVLKNEILEIGGKIELVEDGRVTYSGDEALIARANVFLRTTERVLIQVGRVHAETFDELFEETKKLPWEHYLPKDAKFWVTKATSIKSKLFSPTDIQRIMKKAMVDKMSMKYGIKQFPEDGASYPLRVSFYKDDAIIGLDTSGESLHKRGYRRLVSKAPITETLAAALIMLTPWKKDRILIDPFCGSGTIPIEAALLGLNIAPGLKRNFLGMTWDNIIAEKYWEEAKEEARQIMDTETKLSIQGFDIDADIINSARQNAKAAGVEEQIHFQQRPVKELTSPKKYGFVITNPPYGERLEEKEAMPALYKEIAEAFKNIPTWSYFLITGYEDAQKYLGRNADKNRKIYNGMLKTYFYQYYGPKPPKRN